MSGQDDPRIWQGLRRHLDELGFLAPAPGFGGVVPRRPSGRASVGRVVLATGALAFVVVASALLIEARLRSGPASARIADGAYTLEINAGKVRYAPDEPIDIGATLTYRGPEPRATIFHAHGTPLHFGMIEPINGITLSPAYRLSCESTTLERDVALSQPFGKEGTSLGPDPAFLAFMEDPVFRLPAGSWHVYAVASFAEGDCGGDGYEIRAEILIEIRD